MDRNELYGKIKMLVRKKKAFSQVCKELGLKDYELIGLVNLMKEDGELIDYVNGELVRLKTPPKVNDVYEVSADADHFKLLLLSDTHLCSKYDRLDILRYLYAKAEDLGVKHILHSGDFTDGKSNRPEHIYELKEHSYEGQIDYCVEKYPTFSGKTYVIGGNHDEWWYKATGSEIVKAIANRRDDIVYLGSNVADLKINGLKIRLYHGKGGVAYAKSYKIQKYLDSIPLYERPQILQTGHIHQSFYMKQDDTHCFQTSCLEDLTPYSKSQGFANDKSVWWVDVAFDKRGKITHLTQELETFGAKRLVKRK